MAPLHGRLVLAALLMLRTSAHRPMVNGVSCGSAFGSPEDPLQVPDLTEYWGAHRVVTCDAPVFWLNFSVPDATRRYLDVSAGSLHPASSFGSERLLPLRLDAVVLAPDQPELDISQLEIDLPSGMTKGVLLQSADDVSSCRHAETEMVKEVSQGMCAFYDSFGPWGVWSSVLLDRHVAISAPGLVGIWIRGLKTGKLWVMLGAAGPERPEDLFGNNRIPKASCDDCGNVDPDRPADAFSGSADFWELWTPPGQGLPLVTACAGSPPRESYCSLQGTSTTSTATLTTMTTTRTETSLQDASTSESSSSPAISTTTTIASTATTTSTTTTTTTTTGSSTTSPGDITTSTPQSSSSSALPGLPSWVADMSMGCGAKVCPFRSLTEAAVRQMHYKMAVRFTCDAAVDFVRGMVSHHEGAVAMCAALDASQSWLEVGLVHFCYHVALEQTWEIRGMQRWLDAQNLTAGEVCSDSFECGDLTCASSKAYVSANQRMHEAMKINYTCRAEEDFVQAMLPHHQGAVDMCAVFLESASQDAYLRDLCANITRLQTAEMSWMKDWLSFKGLGISRCSGTSESESPCADMMPITDICHDLGGDRLCDCSELQSQCSSIASAGGRRFAVSTVCRQTCGLCEVKTAADIVVELLELGGVQSLAPSQSSTAAFSTGTTTTTASAARPAKASVASSAGRHGSSLLVALLWLR